MSPALIPDDWADEIQAQHEIDRTHHERMAEHLSTFTVPASVESVTFPKWRGPTRAEWRAQVWHLGNPLHYRLAVLLGLVVSPSCGPRPARG